MRDSGEETLNELLEAADPDWLPLTSWDMRKIAPLPERTSSLFKLCNDGWPNFFIFQEPFCEQYLTQPRAERALGPRSPKRKTRYKRVFLFGGGGESRTPVRKPFHGNFSGRRRLIGIPFPKREPSRSKGR